ncbi:MAG TPA: transcriptional repressor [Thermodesulfobacteriota bacterium]|jgi:Fur family peroxide stress response transcriptional regulator|nr:transcriptional repressor [Thermodesulfobacteriota bacterium]
MKMESATVEKRVNGFIDQCKGLGIKVTPQRVAIYRELANTNEHPSAESIYKKIRNYYPNISLTTIYRTLETFEKLGLVSVVNILYNAARYDANLEPHHHLVCVECKRVEDYYDDSLMNLDFSKKKPANYKVLGYTLQLNGVCKNCRKKRS